MDLIISKDREEMRRTLSQLLHENDAPITSFYSENFSKDSFFQETETYPFLSQKKTLILYDIDQLDEENLQAVNKYLEKPNNWVNLFLTASDLASQSRVIKLIEKRGHIHKIKEEKPWEKEKRLAAWLVDEAKREGVCLSFQVALILVQRVDYRILALELEKLICFTFGHQEITLEDISLLSTPTHHETLWQLGEALFTLSVSKALTIGKALLEEGVTIFSLLASLRSQFMMGIELLSGENKKFPYLKGNFLEKKMQMFNYFGKKRLQTGILLIFETELKAKNSSIDIFLLLEILILKLTNEFVSTSQFVRAC